MVTYSAKETMRIGQNLARSLSRRDVVALYGGLGSGKTVFAKGIGKGLGMKDVRRIQSPTFVIIKEYKAAFPIYHLDLYRLDNLRDIEDIGVEEYIYGDGITIIEWADKIRETLPEQHISVEIIIKGKNKREIKIEDFRH